METALRPMSTSQVLDRTFSLYRNNFLLFAGIAALPPAFLMVGQLGLVAAGRFSGFSGHTGLAIAALVTAALAGIGLLALWLIGYALATGASVYAVSRVHLGYKTSIREAYKLVSPHTGSILGIVVLVFLAVGGILAASVAIVAIPMIAIGGMKALSATGDALTALALLILAPAIGLLILYLSARFSLAVPACVVEHQRVIDSLKRSWMLTTQGSAWRVIGVNILAAIISFAVSAFLSIPYFIGVALSISHKDPAALLPFVIWQYVAGFLARSLAFPIATVSVSLIYYDERVRKEAFDLQLMMEAIGQAQPAPVQSIAASDTPIG